MMTSPLIRLAPDIREIFWYSRIQNKISRLSFKLRSSISWNRVKIIPEILNDYLKPSIISNTASNVAKLDQRIDA